MEQPLTKNIRPNREPLTIEEYEKVGGYQGLRAALKMSPKEVQDAVVKSNLRGRGGAGFPTGTKWSVLPLDDTRRPRYFVVNADEMEPGTMKDRWLLEGAPHQLIEGTIISAYAIQADVAYIFLRDEYQLSAQRLREAIAAAYDRGYLGKGILKSSYNLQLYLHRSAGRYICGEETALLDALQGKRALPRNKPPFPQTVGLFGKETVVNNVETVSNIPHIIVNGAEWFTGLSKSKDGGTKLYGASGKVKRPGLWELPMGTTIREILEDHAGGMREGLTFRGLLPGGASTDFLTAEHLDAKMDFDSLMPLGSRMGTGTMIILDDQTCPVSMLISLEQFFARESCGWCTPCREGLPWVLRTLLAIENGEGVMDDLGVLASHVKGLALGNTFCALAPGAIEPLGSGLKYFRADFERHITEKRCPWKAVSS